MSSYFTDVQMFHHRCGLPVGTSPKPLSPEAWQTGTRLILEELAELAEAQAAGNIEGIADGLVDLVWVIIGRGVEAGIPFDAVWAEVRTANMAKIGGTIDESGKLLKPPEWSRPDIQKALLTSTPKITAGGEFR